MPRGDEGLGERLIARDLHQHAGPQHVRPGVADRGDDQLGADDAGRGQRRPHAAQAGLAPADRVDVVVRDSCSAAQQAREHLGVARRGGRAHLAPHRLCRELGRDLAAHDAPHAVAHDEQRAAHGFGVPRPEHLDDAIAIEVTDQEMILVVLADLTDIGGSRDRDPQRHRSSIRNN